MPMVFLDRLPVPSIRVYTTISIAILSCSVYYAAQIVKDPAWRTNQTEIAVGDGNNVTGNGIANDSRTIGVHLEELLACMVQEPGCIWTLINMAYCVLILLGKSIQKLVFGELRVSERQHLKDKFWNFVFYKFIFVFGVLNVQYMDEVILWCAWFTALGFLSLLSQLCKDRFEYCILLGVRTIHVMLRYAIHLYDTRGAAGNTSPRSWDKRGPLAYYTELTSELTVLAVDFLHHIHMLLWSNIFLSMASLVICMQLRYLFHEIQRRITKHRNYLAVLSHMKQNYPMASRDELAENSDNCAICWEKMESARKLPCGHLFHNSCLQSWLEQDTSCPTCRLTLSMQANHRDSPLELAVVSQTPVRRNENHFFHFDGSRYVSWLPSFSVEVTHSRLRGDILALAHSNSQLDAMARQVEQLFPHYPKNIILEDLRVTRSVELTIENILDGRLILPHHMMEEPETEPVAQTQTTVLPGSFAQNSWDPRFDIPAADSGEEPSNLGGRFSKSSIERELILQRRKEHMLLSARRRYLEKHRNSESETRNANGNLS
ncbi:E3 ubiquitin-protein ligase AMFR isoform X2 [Cephus cinctus]|uniref:E3 ubiquitin-protein ligase AMFR isoform X2 n=1 Tax=Cephus cinctus TaxID=211228 RepID=A0AAJ7RGA7_CEPCN|nr:E3 ubiquitin-protein ligase AMFR isoform X2 [Cephus cinctus]